MNNRRVQQFLSGILIAIFFSGCASIATTLRQEDIQNIKKLAIVTRLSKPELQILDCTGIMQQTFGGYQYGAMGGLLEGLILGAMAYSARKSSLRGDMEALKETVANLPMKELFDNNLTNIFSKNFTIISPQKIESLGVDEYLPKRSVKGRKIKDYTVLRQHFKADTVLDINFVHALAVYEGGRGPSVVIVGDVEVINLLENKLLMRKTISSDFYYRRHYTVDEYNSNDGELFKKELLEAMQGFAYLVASEFGAELSLKHKSYWHPKE